MKLSEIKNAIKSFDKDLEIEESFHNDCYLYVSTNKHRYYVGYFNIDEIQGKRDLMFYLDCINVKER